MKKLSLFLPFIFGCTNIVGQQILWEKHFPSSTQDLLESVSITIDGNYLLAGSSIQPNASSSNHYSYQYKLTKLNPEGHLIWERYYGDLQHDFLAATSATQEGGFIVAGSTMSNNKQNINNTCANIKVIKISEDGKEEWQKIIETQSHDEAKAVIQTTDLGYIVTGNTQNSNLGFGNKDVLVTKLDKEGNIIQQTILGGESLDELEKVIPTKDGGVLLAIYSRSNDTRNLLETRNQNTKTSSKIRKDNDENSNLKIFAKESENFGEGDFWIVKLDSKGIVEWQRSFGGNQDDHIKSIVWTDQGYVVAGETRSAISGNKRIGLKKDTDLWLIAIDQSGNEQWQQSYTVGSRDVLMSFNSIWNKDKSAVKGFLIGGYTQGEATKTSRDETFWIKYIDAKGHEQWVKHIKGKNKKEQERLVYAGLDTEGSYILAGTEANELGAENWMVLKLGEQAIKDMVEQPDLLVYPNPVGDYCYVDIGIDFKEAEISVYDMSGKQIQKIKTINSIHKLDTHTLPQGIYLLNVKTENNNLNTKILKK